MLGRGLSRFVLLATLVVGAFYIFASRTTSIPAEWTSALKSSADAFYPISSDSPAFPDDRFGETGEIVNPIHPGAADTLTPATDKSDQSHKGVNLQDTLAQGSDTLSIPKDAASIVETVPHTINPQSEEKPVTRPEKTTSGNKKVHLPAHYIYNDIDEVHRKVYSISTANKAYFPVIFGTSNAYNPNIIPHRTLNNTYYMVAQESEHSVEQSIWFAELICSARFNNDKLECIKEPSILPITATFGDKCLDKLAFFGNNVGPHDARLFYGPTKPLVLYGSNSAYACFGQFVQDFRMLLDWGFDWNIPKEFKSGTEIQRPGKYGAIEKNFFLFWDAEGVVYAHYDLLPTRSFAKLNDDGSVGSDLGPAAQDEKCLSSLMPAVAAELESIHQATNSLKITMCKRNDTSCVEDESNTFIFTIFQHKSYYSFHSNYEPYVMTFSQTAPFSVHAISQKPIWISGRGLPGQGTRPDWITDPSTWQQTEMFYVTSMSWATQGQTYHGYLDDPLFIAFGIEDSKTGGIDILAGDLFQDLAYCSAL